MKKEKSNRENNNRQYLLYRSLLQLFLALNSY